MTQPITPTQPTQAIPSDIPPWGYHAILDCSNCELVKLLDEANIRTWIAALVTRTGLTAVGDPIIKVTGDALNNTGYTLVQLIVPSAITAHFVDDLKQIYIDIFAHAQFDPMVAEATIKEFFGANTQVNKILIPRNASV